MQKKKNFTEERRKYKGNVQDRSSLSIAFWFLLARTTKITFMVIKKWSIMLWIIFLLNDLLSVIVITVNNQLLNQKYKENDNS